MSASSDPNDHVFYYRRGGVMFDTDLAPGWYFWDETSRADGPHASKREAIEAYEARCEYLNSGDVK